MCPGPIRWQSGWSQRCPRTGTSSRLAAPCSSAHANRYAMTVTSRSPARPSQNRQCPRVLTAPVHHRQSDPFICRVFAW